MKSKKLISLLCAAAMSASAFAGLTETASAATPVYTFDGSDITGFSGNGTLAQVSDDKGEYFSIKANGSSTYSATLTLPADAQLTSADGYTIEYDARLHKSNGMGTYTEDILKLHSSIRQMQLKTPETMAHTVHCSQAVIQVLKQVKDIQQVWHLHCLQDTNLTVQS